jgi:hypothetical protein
VGLLNDWISFPGRVTDRDSTVTEDQEQLNLSVAMIRRLGRTGYVTGEMLYRWTTSNTELSEYEGPVFTFRTRAALPLRLILSSYVAFGHRSYHSLAYGDSLSRRKDDTWQIGTKLTRPLSSRIQVFLEANILRQTSNLDPFAFDQSRVSLGLSVSLVPPHEFRAPALEPYRSRIAPSVGDGGVRFRILAPGASSVAVVGGFNAWDATAHLLSGPDEDGLWEAVIPLHSGVWRYAFVIDGRWVAPPDAPRYEEDGFGGRHGVLEVSASQGDDAVTQASGSRRRE